MVNFWLKMYGSRALSRLLHYLNVNIEELNRNFQNLG